MNDLETVHTTFASPAELRAAAVDYATEECLHIFPVAPEGKIPACENGFYDATNDPEQVEAWWLSNPRANIGWVPGKDGKIVLDYDPTSMAPDAWELMRNLDRVAPTRSVSTPARGFHRVFDLPHGVIVGNSKGALPKGVDVRAHNGYVLLPPSTVRYDGDSARKKGVMVGYKGAYAVDCDRPTVEIPDWLLERILRGVRGESEAREAAPEAVARSLSHVTKVLKHGGIAHIGPADYEGGLRFILTRCPFNPPEDPHEDDRAAFVIIQRDGRILAGCHHNRCQERIAAAGGNAWGLIRREAGFDEVRTTAQSLRPIPPLEAASHVGHRPEIVCNNRQLDALSRETLAAIMANGSERFPRLLLRAGELVQVIESEGIVRKATTTVIRSEAAQAATWVRKAVDARGATSTTESFPPRDVAEDIGAMSKPPGVPLLRSVVSVPILTQSGEWVTSRGFHHSGHYLLQEFKLGDTTPTRANVQAAKGLLFDDLLVDFPFADEASKSHAVALFLLGFVRDLIDGPTPLHVVDAPAPGTGKGLLVSALTDPTVKDGAASIPGADTDDEWRKRLTSVLREGATHVNLDNLAGVLRSPSLAAATTQTIWKDRILGGSDTVAVPVRCIWTATANNLAPSDEMVRRCVWIRLDAKVERPQDRNAFKHKPLMPWVKAHKADLVTSAIVLVKYWQQQGSPLSTAHKGSYESWAAVIGGILEANEIGGFLGNEMAFYESAASDLQAFMAFIEKWWELHGTAAVNGDDLMMIAGRRKWVDADGNHKEEGIGILDTMLGDKSERSRQSKLGRLIADRRDQVFMLSDGAAVKVPAPKQVMGKTRYWLLDAS